METVIVICLLIIIALLMQDRIVITKNSEQKPTHGKVTPNLPDIMGQPKPVRSFSVPTTADISQIGFNDINPDNLDIEYDENENPGIQITQEELDKVFRNIPDWGEEEEEWNSYGISDGYSILAQGVTFEELSSVGALLQRENLEQAQKETASDIVQRLQGTELFSLLENSVEGTSRKIAELLDSTLSSETEGTSFTLRKSDVGDFDIGEYV